LRLFVLTRTFTQPTSSNWPLYYNDTSRTRHRCRNSGQSTSDYRYWGCKRL